MIGIIPAILGDNSPRPYPLPVEMLPFGTQEVGGKQAIRPLSQKIVEEMNRAGVSHIVWIINSQKAGIGAYYRDGMDFNTPMVYMWQPNRPGIAAAISATYHAVRGQHVLVCMPGLVTPQGFIQKLCEKHLKDDADITIAVRGNSGAVSDLRESMLSVYAWSPAFTELLREYVSASKEPSMLEAFQLATQKGMSVRGVHCPAWESFWGNWAGLYRYYVPVRPEENSAPASDSPSSRKNRRMAASPETA